MAKINGRPLLPWWVYALYFAFAITVAVWHNVAHGDEMAEESRNEISRIALASAVDDLLNAIERMHGMPPTSDPRLERLRSHRDEVLRIQGGEASRRAKRRQEDPAGFSQEAAAAAQGWRSVTETGDSLDRGYRSAASDAVSRETSKEIAQKGRFGDTELAHVNPFEKAILKAMGGAGTTNPKTGYKEYYDAVDAGVDVAAGDFGGAGVGLASDTGMGSGPAGGGAGTGGFDPTSIGLDVARGNYAGAGLGMAGSVPSAGPQGGNQGTGGFNINPIDRLNNPKTAGPTLAGLLGGSLFGGLAYGAQALNDRFFDGKARSDVDLNSVGTGGMGDAIAGALNTQPVAAPLPAYMRPAEESAPAAFGMAGGMTDLQKRAQIATGGTQGNSGQFRTPDAMRYYGNLIARALIGDNNAVAQQSPNLLPIEDTYLKQVFGVTPQNNSASLLDALKPYWSR